MRSFVTSFRISGLLICSFAMGLAAPAAAAAVRHKHPHHHGWSERIAPHPAGEYVPPGWYKFPGYPPIPPEENRNLDPSNFGGG
jgi:hypothetical protein